VKGRNIPYSEAELAFIEWRQAMSRRALHAAFVAKFGRADVSFDNFKALCTRRGWRTGRDGCFEKGAAPANKGKHYPPGKGANHPNAVRTRFKKGNRTGRANHVYKPIGAERLSKDGYVERKIHDGLPLQSRWRGVHRIEWEKLHGPVPKGHALKCLDGNRQNTDPSNWQAVPRALLPRLVGGTRKTKVAYDDAPAELKPTILAVARLEHAVRQRRRGEIPTSEGRTA
jgi:hypothetical protein